MGTKNASAAGTSLRIGTCTTAPTELPKRTWSARNDSFASCAGMSHGLTVMAPSGFLSRLTTCAESQDLRPESLDVRKATLAKVLARAAPGLRLNEHLGACLFSRYAG